MAFEDQPVQPATPQPPVVKRPFFDSVAFISLIIGILLLVGILFLFRHQIVAKIAEWRGSGSTVSTIHPTVPPIVIAPAPSTPTPSATVSPGYQSPPPSTPTPTSVPPNPTSNPGNFPKTGPEDTIPLALGGFALIGSTVRFHYYRTRLKKRANQIDIV